MDKYGLPFSIQELTTALDELGLSLSERQLYLSSLAFGPLPIPDLAKNLGFERPYVYTLIKSLRDRGLVASQPSMGYQKKFVVESPTALLSLLRKKKAHLESLTSHIAMDMPKYLASYRQGGTKTQVLFYESKEKFFELYERILEEEADETLYFGEVEHYFSLLGEQRVRKWITQRSEKKIKIKTLMVESETSLQIPSNKSVHRETRLLPKEMVFDFPASFQLFGNNVIFWQPETPIAVVLQDEYIAKMHRSIFNLLWKQGIEYIPTSQDIPRENY